MKIHWYCGVWPQLCSRHLTSVKVILSVCSQLPGVRLVPRYWVHIRSQALARPVTLFCVLLWIAMESIEPHTLFSWHRMMANSACWLARWHSSGVSKVYLCHKLKCLVSYKRCLFKWDVEKTRVRCSFNCTANHWYLFQEEEDAVHFADRVKAVIAAQGGMSVLPW